jgi:hypothetical protein
MMSLLSPLHAIAAQRGEGLRPELVRLLERSKVASEPRKREGHEVEEANTQAERLQRSPEPVR